ncbi:DNA repair helicase XPB [Mechercharimyces sp. CAU 1602]|uniref:DNA repair helicase XPB n=1 Tax=Mechercharimyces sp. CAU 1602 TaxID=2973933 RepID=UPI002161CAC7|nr:DNA repair helicase XPB [Mechercharimyces sp. CAU 1602]MCS1350176.1 DEAD/DEAH box helicase [Mechercharimyces sp. CAU 1602]
MELPLLIDQQGRVRIKTEHPQFPQVRAQVEPFSERVKSPSGIHTYQLTPISLWNAAANGLQPAEVLEVLHRYSNGAIPLEVEEKVRQEMGRYGQIQIQRNSSGELILACHHAKVAQKLHACEWVEARTSEKEGIFYLSQSNRGRVKQQLLQWGWPVHDCGGYEGGEKLRVRLAPTTVLRDYQREAMERFYVDGGAGGGNGVLVLPCGAGKTIIGVAAIERIGKATLVLTTNRTSVQQWIRELQEKLELSEDQIGEYTGERKEVKPITVATYHILTYRRSAQQEFAHMNLFQQRDWGLIIYDEVHLLPAPIFRATAELQATRRLGLTATLVREDGREQEVFSLIGPKRYDLSWKELEHAGWIAKAHCVEIRLPLSRYLRKQMVKASKREQMRLAAENEAKDVVVQQMVEHHQGERILIIGQYLQQLERVAHRLDVPLVTGKTPNSRREQLYQQFRRGDIEVLVVSKVANFAVDLPDASVAIQLSGTFGSRQEEAQRLGRILRPKKKNEAIFYSLVSQGSVEQKHAFHRQLFLVQQGYTYHTIDADHWRDWRR